MTPNPPSILQRIRTWINFTVAFWAMRLGGPETIYWTDPQAWEDYMNKDGEYGFGGDPEP